MRRRRKRKKTKVTLLACNDIDPEFFWLEIEERKLVFNAFALQISTERFISQYTFLLSIEFVRLRTIGYFQSFSIHSHFSSTGKFLKLEESRYRYVDFLLNFSIFSKSLICWNWNIKVWESRRRYVVGFWKKSKENCTLKEYSWHSYATASLNRWLLVFYSLFVPTTHVPSADVVQVTRSPFIKLNYTTIDLAQKEINPRASLYAIDVKCITHRCYFHTTNYRGRTTGLLI